jgi:DNA-binding LacI/PurR family transcriptional regulator
VASIKDVALRAGVGSATVSRVLNGSLRVSENTRQRVLQAIQELDYVPHAAARQLSSGKTRTIGIITPFLTLYSFVERIAGIQDALQNSGYDLVLYGVGSNADLRRTLTMLLSQRKVDGALVLSMPFEQEEFLARDPDFPLIIIDSPIHGVYPSLSIDNEAGGRLATNYLISKGHEHIGFLGDIPKGGFGFNTTQLRFLGYQNALRAAGLEVNLSWHRLGRLDTTIAQNMTEDLLGQAKRPSALFCAIDLLAFGALKAARKLGLRVPQDLAIIGFDNVEAADYLNLTTVSQGLYQSGYMGAQSLLAWLNEGRKAVHETHKVLPLEVIVRESA